MKFILSTGNVTFDGETQKTVTINEAHIDPIITTTANSSPSSLSVTEDFLFGSYATLSGTSLTIYLTSGFVGNVAYRIISTIYNK